MPVIVLLSHYIKDICVKVFLLFFGLGLVAFGLSALPVVVAADTQETMMGIVENYRMASGAAAAGIIAGIIAIFIAGVAFGKGQGDLIAPESCPECGNPLEGSPICSECKTNGLPPVFAFGTVSFIGAVIAFLLAGGVIGTLFMKMDIRLTGMFALSAMGVSLVSVFMSLGSMFVTKRKKFMSVLAFLLGGGVFGFMVYIFIA
jgi:hypothetical protein